MATRWIEERSKRFVVLVKERGMTITEEAASVVVGDQLEQVMTRMRITEPSARRYVTDDVLATMADRIVASLAGEAPGTDPLLAERDTTIAVPDLGRLIAGLAETGMQYADHPAVDETERHLRTSEIMSMLSVCGLLTSDHTEDDDDIAVPAMFLARVARTLDNAAAMTANSDLAAALRRDADMARSYKPAPEGVIDLRRGRRDRGR